MSKKQYERPVIVKFQSGFMNKFGTGTNVTPMKEIDSNKIEELTNKFGSPLFVLSEKTIRNNYKNLLRIFKNRYPKVQLAWSYKTNYLNAVCSIYHQEGSWAEVVSEFEYQKARNLGVKGSNIIYNGPYKSSDSLLIAMKEGARIHIDHFDELYTIAELAEKNNLKANVAIRVNMDTGVYPKWDRFGFNYENGEAWQALKRIISNNNLNLSGLHTHIGTYMMTTDAYYIAAKKLTELMVRLKNEFQISLEYIDLGGGFPSQNTLLGQYLPAEQMLPSLEQYADAITSGIFEFPLKKEELPILFLETGRALIDSAGFLISKVIANKRLTSGKKALIIDAGVNILFTAFWYKHKIQPGQDSGMNYEDTAIYGPLCMNIDCVRESINLPSLKVGDHLVIHNVGAYNMTQWMEFITYRPNIVLIGTDNSLEIIRRGDKLDDIISQEHIPDRLKKFSL